MSAAFQEIEQEIQTVVNSLEEINSETTTVKVISVISEASEQLRDAARTLNEQVAVFTFEDEPTSEV
ncbi:MAG: hypothetical protein ACOCW5_03215 [Spirochaetia bacterium]